MFSLNPQQLSGEFNTLIDEENMQLIVVHVDTIVLNINLDHPQSSVYGVWRGF